MSMPCPRRRALAIAFASLVTVATSLPHTRYEAWQPLFEQQGLIVRVGEGHPMGDAERRIVRQIDVHFTLKNARAHAVAFSTRAAAIEGGPACAEPVEVRLAAGDAREFCLRFVFPGATDMSTRHLTLGEATLEDGRRVTLEVDLSPR